MRLGPRPAIQRTPVSADVREIVACLPYGQTASSGMVRDSRIDSSSGLRSSPVDIYYYHVNTRLHTQQFYSFVPKEPISEKHREGVSHLEPGTLYDRRQNISSSVWYDQQFVGPTLKSPHPCLIHLTCFDWSRRQFRFGSSSFFVRKQQKTVGKETTLPNIQVCAFIHVIESWSVLLRGSDWQGQRQRRSQPR